MNDVNGLGAEHKADESSTAALATSPGALLRSAREAAGVSVEALAGAMKVSVKKIEGLEVDNYAALPDVVFARALAASICRVFGVDSVPVLALMPKGGVQSLSSMAADINASFKDSSERPRRNSIVAQATRPLGVAVVVLLLGAGVFVFLPYRGDVPESTGTGSIPYVPAAATDMPLEMALPTDSLPDSILPQTEGGAAAAVQGVTAPSALGQAEEVAPLEPAKATAAPSTSMLEFSARGPSWVQVRDASKKIVFERTLSKGESASAAGAPPLQVVVGRADAIDVKVRGAQFGLADVAKNNVARFEVQ